VTAAEPEEEEGGGGGRAAVVSDEEPEEEEEAAAGPAKRSKPGKKAGGGETGVGGKAHEAAAAAAKYDAAGAGEGLWQPGAPVPFLFLARTFEACGETTKRLEISGLVANALRSIIATTPADLLPAVYLASCSIAPQYQGADLGVGDAMLVKALAESTGRSEEAIKTAVASVGDLGVVAMQARATQRTMFAMPHLTVRGVLATLRDIAATSGTKSSERKRALIKKLLVSAREVEAGYIIRLLKGALRVGIMQATVITALAHAALLQEEAPKALQATPLAERLARAEGVLKQARWCGRLWRRCGC